MHPSIGFYDDLKKFEQLLPCSIRVFLHEPFESFPGSSLQRPYNLLAAKNNIFYDGICMLVKSRVTRCIQVIAALTWTNSSGDVEILQSAIV